MASTADQIKLIQSQIDAYVQRLVNAPGNLATAKANKSINCSDKPYCDKKGGGIFPNCYSVTGNTNDAVNPDGCVSDIAAVAMWANESVIIPPLLAAKRSDLAKLQGTSSVKSIVIWTLVIISGGLIIFFVGKHYKWWGK